MLALDAKDRIILSVLDMNARESVTSIARKAAVSREVAAYRIKQLEKKGIIQRYYTALDVSKLGYLYCRIFLKYRTMSKSKERELLDYCKASKHVIWVTLGEGKWDFSIVVLAK